MTVLNPESKLEEMQVNPDHPKSKRDREFSDGDGIRCRRERSERWMEDEKERMKGVDLFLFECFFTQCPNYV